MAKVTMYRAVIRATTQREALTKIDRVMREVQLEARIQASIGPYTTGRLARSIERDGPIALPGGDVIGSIGSNKPYAASAHSGADVHSIFPKAAKGVWRFGSRRRPQLRFFWRKHGRVVYLPHIPGALHKVGFSHPGQPGKHYLSGPLERIARRRGFRVTVYEV